MLALATGIVPYTALSEGEAHTRGLEMPSQREIAHRRARHRSNERSRAVVAPGPRIVWRDPAFDLRENDPEEKVIRAKTPMLAASFDDGGGHVVYANGEIRVFAFA